MYIITPLALLGGFAVCATANRFVRREASSSSAAPVSNPIPTVAPADLSKFTATMKVDEENSKCYIELDMASIGCVGNSSDLIQYGKPSNTCYAELSVGAEGDDHVCGSAKGYLSYVDQNRDMVGKYEFHNQDDVVVLFEFDHQTDDKYIMFKPGATGTPSPATTAVF
ncbi:hypothetical protein NUU61_007444 [Penicillium alfredii]|uniref:Uncharacterized protein n=1 Tax=Penicillium alfredii TaxID=1506179 RepID=A0A9W9F2W3_9EURO|nr:uncharacterized protein NUU61_007444 [Penicillium alfredii]KAJ5092574.1 hypothetical protein NUU61_007444 [Penicillium alfredii]